MERIHTLAIIWAKYHHQMMTMATIWNHHKCSESGMAIVSIIHLNWVHKHTYKHTFLSTHPSQYLCLVYSLYLFIYDYRPLLIVLKFTFYWVWMADSIRDTSYTQRHQNYDISTQFLSSSENIPFRQSMADFFFMSDVIVVYELKICRCFTSLLFDTENFHSKNEN